MLGEPRVMQQNPVYDNVFVEVQAFLLKRAKQCENAGIAADNIVLDPGFGFGKTLQHNIELFQKLPKLARGAYPLLVGVSRKAMIGQLTGKDMSGRDMSGRVSGSIAAAVLAAQMGASIVRVHDVAQTSDALKVATALSGGKA